MLCTAKGPLIISWELVFHKEFRNTSWIYCKDTCNKRGLGRAVHREGGREIREKPLILEFCLGLCFFQRNNNLALILHNQCRELLLKSAMRVATRQADVLWWPGRQLPWQLHMSFDGLEGSVATLFRDGAWFYPTVAISVSLLWDFSGDNFLILLRTRRNDVCGGSSPIADTQKY